MIETAPVWTPEEVRFMQRGERNAFILNVAISLTLAAIALAALLGVTR